MRDTILYVLNNLAVVYILVLILTNYKVLVQSKHIEFSMMLYSSLFVNVGYAFVAFANSLDEVMIAQKIIYVLNLPMLLFMIFIVSDICNLRLGRKVRYALAFVTISAIGCALTIGHGEIFYKTVGFHKDGRLAVFERTYGPLHTYTTIVMMLFMIMATLFALYALTRPKLSSSRKAIVLASVEIFSLFLYFIQRALHLNYELMPYMHCITMTTSLIALRRMYIFDANRAGQQTRENYHDSGILVFDNEKRFVGANETIKKMLPQVQEYTLDRMLPSSSKGAIYFYGMMDELNGNPARKSVEQFFDSNDKVYIYRTRRLYEDIGSGAQKGFVVELIDDTENQNYLRKIQKMNFDLENAIEDAENANAAKSNFLANMSHEIRTPINAVLGLNSIIIRDSKEEKTIEYAENIQVAGNALLSLINDILDFSKIEAGKMDIVPDKYGVNSLINDCYSMLSMKLKDKNLEFMIENDETMPSVLLGDEVRIRQICINLLNNAVKYTEEGSVLFKVGYKPLSDAMVKLCISVTDTGQGISEENQRHLFESFKRIEEKRNRNIEGTGLGLALVKTLAELMGGEIFVQSTLNVGSTFTVEIPQKVVDKSPAGKYSPLSIKKNESQNMDDLENTEGTILVVDDVKMNLKVVVHLLDKSKLTIDTAESGLEAIALVKEKKYDIIFLDHMMPGMDGIETLHQMKMIQNNPNENTPVVMLTANAIEGVKEEYLQEGFDEYLAKPVNFAPLCAIIKKYI